MVTVVERAAELLGAGVAVIAIRWDVTAARDLSVDALVRLGIAERLRAGLTVVSTLLGRLTAAGDRQVVAQLRSDPKNPTILATNCMRSAATKKINAAKMLISKLNGR